MEHERVLSLDLMQDHWDLPSEPVMVSVADGTNLPVITAYRLLASRLQAQSCHFPILLKDTFHPESEMASSAALLRSSVNLGALLCDGIGDAICCLLYTSPSPRDQRGSRMPSSA